MLNDYFHCKKLIALTFLELVQFPSWPPTFFGRITLENFKLYFLQITKTDTHLCNFSLAKSIIFKLSLLQNKQNLFVVFSKIQISSTTRYNILSAVRRRSESDTFPH